MTKRLWSRSLLPIALVLTACNTQHLVIEHEAPVVSVLASPSSLPEAGGTATINGVAVSTAPDFTVVLTELRTSSAWMVSTGPGEGGSSIREVCRSTQSQFSCSVTLPALGANEIRANYLYSATITDSRGGVSHAMTRVVVGRMVP